MAKNLGRKFATMSEDERRRFALEEEEGSRELPAELVFDEPRNEDRMGQQYANPEEETADPEHRDGLSAQLDEQQHQRAVRKQAAEGKSVEDVESSESRIDDA
jgi:hypothetical protein